MLRRLLLCVALALFPALASAQITPPGFPPGTFNSRAPIDAAGGAPPSFTGPCDISACTGAYGFIAGTAAYASAHSPAVDICDTATCGTTVTINFLSTGLWDAATAAANAVCSVSCSATNFYDSTGNLHPAPFTTGTRPTIAFGNLGTCSAAIAIVTGGTFKTAAFTSVPTWSMVGIAERTTSLTTEQYFIGSTTGTALGWFTAATQGHAYAGAASATVTGVTDSAYHAFVFVSGTSGSLNIDSLTPTTINTGGTAVADLFIMADSFGNRQLSGRFIFAAMMPSAVTASTMNTNLHSQCGGF